MTVFKNYFKVLTKNKGIIVMYTVILLIFTVFSTSSGSKSINFTAARPNILIVNNDTDSNVVNNLKDYLGNSANIKDNQMSEDNINDALFYDDIDAVLYIYNGYTNDYLNNNDKLLDIKYGTTASASYAKMLIERYLKIADITNDHISDETTMLNTINDSLNSESNIQIDSKVNTDALDVAGYFYSFANYSILAVCIYIISIIMNTFNQDKIRRRNFVSSKPISSITKELYLGNLVFTFMVWVFIVVVSFLVAGNIMFTKNGLLLIINSFVFMFVALGIGFLIGTILRSKGAITGVMNVIALGSSFLCGSFIPQRYLPSAVTNFSQYLPSFFFIKNNDIIKSLQDFTYTNIEPIIINMIVMLLYAAVFLTLTVLYNKKHVKE